MAKKSFKLMSASSLASLAAASTGGAPEEEDEDAGPAPEGSGDDGDDADAKSKDSKSDDKETGDGKDKEADADDGDGEEVEAVAAADAIAHGQAQHAAGVAAERTRTEKVLSSKEGQANQANAAFLLANTDASADKIIKQLATAPGAAPAAAADEEKPEKKADIENTDVDLGTGADPTAALEAGGGTAPGKKGDEDGWDAAIEASSYQQGSIDPTVAQVNPAAAAAAAQGGTITVPALKTGH